MSLKTFQHDKIYLFSNSVISPCCLHRIQCFVLAAMKINIIKWSTGAHITLNHVYFLRYYLESFSSNKFILTRKHRWAFNSRLSKNLKKHNEEEEKNSTLSEANSDVHGLDWCWNFSVWFVRVQIHLTKWKNDIFCTHNLQLLHNFPVLWHGCCLGGLSAKKWDFLLLPAGVT